MITTITLNPSIDKTLIVKNLHHNIRVFYEALPPEVGGKGINISKILNTLHIRNKALVLLGGDNGRQFQKICKSQRINTLSIKISESTRENITLLVSQPARKEFKMNGVGPQITSKEIILIKNTISRAICSSTWVTIGGSLPLGVTEEIFNKPLSAAYKSGTKIIYDGESKAFLDMCGANLFLIKPNRHELTLLTGDKPKSLEQFATSARKLLRSGVENILLTLDSDGALWINAQGVWHAKCPLVKIQSTIGAGDSSIAGAIAGWNQGGSHNALTMAVACGTATAMCAGSSVGDIKTIKQLALHTKIKKITL